MSEKREELIEYFKREAEESISSWYQGYSKKYWSQLPTNPTSQVKNAHLEKIIRDYNNRISDYEESIKKYDWRIETVGLKIRNEHWEKVDSYIEVIREKYIRMFEAEFIE